MRNTLATREDILPIGRGWKMYANQMRDLSIIAALEPQLSALQALGYRLVPRYTRTYKQGAVLIENIFQLTEDHAPLALMALRSNSNEWWLAFGEERLDLTFAPTGKHLLSEESIRAATDFIANMGARASEQLRAASARTTLVD